MEMDLQFNKYFKIPITAMNLILSHPDIRRNRRWLFKMTISRTIYTIVFIILVDNIINNDIKNKDFSQTCKNGILTVVYLVIMLQDIILITDSRSLTILMESVEKDFEKSKALPIDEQKTVIEYANRGRRVCKLWQVVSFCGPFSFVLNSVVLTIHSCYAGQCTLFPFHDLVYPSIIEDNKENIFVFLVTYGLLLYFGIYSCLLYAAFAPLGPIFMLHLCGQLELVKKRVDDIFSDENNNVVTGKMRDVIEQLQYIYRLQKRIEQFFMVVYEFTLKGSALMLPITFYEILESISRGEVSLDIFNFITGATLISSSPCIYGDLLMEKGEEIRLALFSCGWEGHYDLRIRSTFLIMLQRALKPIAIRTMFRTVCLDALTNLFQQSYAIFNLMCAMWN